MTFNDGNNLSPKDQEVAKNILSEAQKFTNHKQYFNSFEFENFTTNIKLSFPKELKYSIDEERYFIFLLSRCKSLNKIEKLNILNMFQKLSLQQIIKLGQIFEEEITAFNLMVSKKQSYISEISQMKFDSIKDWKEIENIYNKKQNKRHDKKYYGANFYAKPNDIESILKASKVETQYFFGGIIRARDGFLEQITYLDEIPLDIIINGSYYHCHEEEFKKKLKEHGINLRQISYFRNKNLGKILTELNIYYDNPKDRFERSKILLNLKKQGFISKILNYLLFS
jgi:hypothetical protein